MTLQAVRTITDADGDRWAVERALGSPNVQIVLDPGGPDESWVSIPAKDARRLAHAILKVAASSPQIDIRNLQIIRPAQEPAT